MLLLTGDDAALVARFIDEHPHEREQLRELQAAHGDLLPFLREWFAEHPPAPGSRPGASAGGGDEVSIPGFRLIREIGRGGMGIVYRAEQLSPRREVALKVVPFEGKPEVRERFEREV